MEVDAGDRSGELAEAVEDRLVLPPVEALSPVAAKLLHVREIGAVRPRPSGRLIREARAAEPLAKVGQHGVGDVDAERCRCDGAHPLCRGRGQCSRDPPPSPALAGGGLAFSAMMCAPWQTGLAAGTSRAFSSRWWRSAG